MSVLCGWKATQGQKPCLRELLILISIEHSFHKWCWASEMPGGLPGPEDGEMRQRQSEQRGLCQFPGFWIQWRQGTGQVSGVPRVGKKSLWEGRAYLSCLEKGVSAGEVRGRDFHWGQVERRVEIVWCSRGSRLLRSPQFPTLPPTRHTV